MAVAGNIGRTSGMLVGLDNVRQRRYREAQDALAAKERERQHTREDFYFDEAKKEAGRAKEDWQYRTGRRGQTDTREDLAWEQGQADRQRTLSEHSEDRTRAMSQEDADIARTRTLRGREDTEWQQQQREYDQLQEQARAEGMQQLIQKLQNGADPNMALREFNRSGEWRINPSTFRYDPTTGGVEFVDHEGERFTGSIDELAASFGLIGEAAPEPVRLGKDDRLVNPRSGETIVGPSAGGTAGDGTSPGGRKPSTYNPETTQKEIANGIAQNFEGQMDLLGNWSLANSEDRGKVTYLQSLGTDIEGRYRSYVMDGVLTGMEIAQAVNEAGQAYETDSQLRARARAEAGRDEQAQQRWISDERRRQRDAVSAKLAQAERRLLAQAQKAAEARPDWATGASYGMGGDYGLSVGETAEARDPETGRTVIVRVADDGQVYEVGQGAR